MNGKIICSGVLATEIPDPLPSGQSRLELFNVLPDGSQTTRLMSNTNSDYSPRYSADGKKVAFVKDSQIWTMNADGTSKLGPLTDQGSNSFTGDWTPDGKDILFQSNRDGNNEVYRMHADGTHEENLTKNSSSDTQPALSPDGKKVAFQSKRSGNSDIWVMNADGTNPVNITAPSPAEESAPRWSPDGALIAFHSDRSVYPRPDIARNLEIFRMNADGTNIVQLTFSDYDPNEIATTDNLTGYDVYPAWSPDQTRLVFHSGRAAEYRDSGDEGIIAQWEAYTINSTVGEANGDLVRVTNRPGNDERCDWQPLQPGAPPLPPVESVPPLTPERPSADAFRLPAKMSVLRAKIHKSARVLDVLAPITRLASGTLKVELHAAGLHYRFTEPVHALGDGLISFKHKIPAKQANLGTGIVTLEYPGDSDTRPQTVRLRAASQSADLEVTRPRIVDGRLSASGTIAENADGVVRVQIQWVNNGRTTTNQYNAQIGNGKWSLNVALSESVLDSMVQRNGTVQSYTLFTGFQPARIRGEMGSLQVLGNRLPDAGHIE